MRSRIAALGGGLAVVAALLWGGAATAAGHVQVSPTVAAPGDAVRFTVLVPGERSDASTTRVALKVPAGVLPYSYGETPGWKRHLVAARDGSVAQIVWTGQAKPDAFVELSFLAATPSRPGTIAWKSLQRYSDGEVVRWIGSPSSEHPAPVTEIEAGALLQNAGGEGGSGGDGPEQGGATGAAAAAAADDGGGSGDGPDWVARGLALAALALAAAALTVLVSARGRRR